MRRTAALAALLALLAAAGTLAIASLATRDAASAFVPGGSGPAAFVAEARAAGQPAARLLSGPEWLASDPALDPAHTLLVVAQPPKGYGAAEAQAFRAFLERGGHALVADSFGRADTLTAQFGISFERVRLVEAGAADTVTATLDGKQYRLAPGAMTALHLADGASVQPLARSSPASFLDRDGDGAIQAADPRGPFPVAAEVAVGGNGGSLLALATPDVLRAGAADNEAFRAALQARLLPDGGRVVVDESRAGSPDPVLAALAVAAGTASSSPWRYLLGGLGLLLVAAALRPHRDDGWGPHRFRPDRFIRRARAEATARAAAPHASGSTWTQRGAAALLGGAGLLCAGLALQSTQATFAGGLLECAVLAALLLGPPAVTASRTLAPSQLAEGGTVRVRLELEGAARHHHAELEFLDGIPSEFEVNAGSNWFQARLGMGVSAVEYDASPSLRGAHAVGPLRVRRMDALRLRLHEGEVGAAQAVEVAPRKEPLNRSPFKTRVPTTTLGPHLVNRAGDGSEFHSLREYHPGDPFRAINWKASARSKNLVVSQKVHESRTTLTIFLDARAASGAGPANATPIAHGCRVVLGVATGAVQVRDRVRIVLYGGETVEIPPGPGPRQLHELTRTLSQLEARGDTPFLAALQGVLPGLRAGTPVLLVSGLEGDASIVQGMTLLRSKGMLPTVIASPLHTAPADPADGGPEPDAQRIQDERTATVKALRGAGIPVLEAIEGVPLEFLFRLGAVA
ncbi:MAG TPA: DUF4350 domain-containing protein [Candidatus Thermoplasmatota archaeon]|nr:DUF4350 domain-containing protein [Candidatus Thermoplasmatota archaeon]